MLFLACVCCPWHTHASEFTQQFWQPSTVPSHCPISFSPLKLKELMETEIPTEQLAIRSDHFKEVLGSHRTFTGNVSVSFRDLLLKSEEVVMKSDKQLHFPTGFEIYHPQGAAAAAEATLDPTIQQVENPLNDLSFVLYEPPLEGEVKSIEVAEQKVSVIQMVLSGCQPSNRTWSMGARRASINRETDRISMRGFYFKLGKIPVVYIPYLTFKPREETSGLGSIHPDYRSDNGLILKQPFQLIRDQYRLNFEPRYLQNNGLQLGFEINSSVFDLAMDWVPEDRKVTDDVSAQIEPNRWYLKSKLSHQARNWNIDIDLLETSDFRYRHDYEFDTFDKAEFATTSSANIQINPKDWRISLLVQSFNSTFTDSLLAQQLPELDVRWQPIYRRTQATSRLNLGYFDRPHYTGSRVHLEQRFGIDLSPKWADWQVNSTLAATQYDSNSVIFPSNNEERLETTIDSTAAVHFDRWTNNLWMSISPTIHYLNRDIQELPNQPYFDSVYPIFQPMNLFKDQQTSSIDARFDEERLAAGIQIQARPLGQTERKLTFNLAYITSNGPGSFDIKQESWATTMNYQVSDSVSLEHSQTFVDRTGQQQRSSLLLYSPKPDKAVYLATHKRWETTHQTEFGLEWPLGNRLEVIAGAHYNWHNEEIVESRLGLAIKSCCLRTLLFAQHAIDWRFEDNSFQVEPTTRFTVQFEFTGLGKVGGNRLESLLNQKRYFTH